MTVRNLLAVYGALKRGGPLNGMLVGAEYLGTTCIKEFVMEHCRSHPAAVPFDGFYILCEIYEVNEKILARIDRIENSVNDIFCRTKVASHFGPVWLYVKSADTLKANGSRIVPNGVWKGALTEAAVWLGVNTERKLKDNERRRGGAVWQCPLPTEEHHVVAPQIPRELSFEETIQIEIHKLPKTIDMVVEAM